MIKLNKAVLIISILVSCYIAGDNTHQYAFAQTQPYLTGYQAALNNNTESCDIFKNNTGPVTATLAEDHCQAGYDDGQLKLMQSTHEYYQADKNDSKVIGKFG
ncbi:MAG: hypothetical protein WAM14_23330 [Candidatus Nitrosopolaris sp.]